jgi:archaellum component FlaF (FlaF/FlaG flagellin family)
MAAVKSNGSETPVYLTMKGVVLGDFRDYSGEYPYSFGDLLFDRSDLEFDDVNKGDAPVQEIHILNNGTTKMDPRLLHLPPYLSASIAPETLAPGRAGTITVTLDSEKLRDYGLTQTSVYLAQQLGEKVSADNEMPVSVILLPDLKAFEAAHNTAAPKLQMSSTEIDFTDFGGKSKKTAEITLVNTGSSRFTVSSLQMFTSGLKVTLGKRELAPGQSTTLKVVGYAADLAKVRTRPRILMITNDPDHSKVVVNIKK